MLEHRVFVVDDDSSWQGIFRESIEDMHYTEVENERILKEGERYTLQFASSYEEADAILDRQHFHLALIDLRLREDAEELEGKKLVQKIAKLAEGTSIIVVSGYADATIATELLKGYDCVFYLIEKDNLDSKRLTDYVKGAISWARNQYRIKFVSAIDFLRGDQSIDPWIANALQVILGADRISTVSDVNHLGDLLDRLLLDLYPLLYHRSTKSAIIDSETGVVGAYCWSKALAQPILLRFGRREVIDREVEIMGTRPAIQVQNVFVQIKRDEIEADLGGIVYVPVCLPFDDFVQGI